MTLSVEVNKAGVPIYIVPDDVSPESLAAVLDAGGLVIPCIVQRRGWTVGIDSQYAATLVAVGLRMA